MNLSAPFISRPVATLLLTVAIAIAGALAYTKLPVAPLPQVDFPTISVQAQLPGASPETVATSLSEPLERHLGQVADVTEMTSQSQVGQARITLQFGLNRNINGAASDVQAAINAAQADLPANLLSRPTYRKVNPADAPVIILALTSNTLTRGQMFDAASSVAEQEVSQISGVGQVIIGGAATPAVRVELNPQQLFHYGIGIDDVRSALANSNANAPKGDIDVGAQRWQIYTNDQANKASDYKPVIVGYRNGDAVKLADVAEVDDSVQNLRNLGLADGKPAVLVIVFRQPGANVVSTVDAVRAAIPRLKAGMPKDIQISVANDASLTIRASLDDTRMTLGIAVLLVVAVVFVYLRNWRATIIPAVAVPISIIGAFAAMYLLRYSLDNLSLMALTIATGFVVDDAIVVLENISRHIEAGTPRVEAALLGAREVGFTVVSITLSLIAVFLPILLMGGLVGRLFQEFAVTLSMAIVISMMISLTTTPMLCSLLLRGREPRADRPRKRTLFERLQDRYAAILTWALDHAGVVLLILAGTIALNVWLILIIPKGFFPQQDTGRMIGNLQADQDISFQAMSQKLTQMMSIVRRNPAVQSVVGYTGQGGGGGAAQTNTGNMYIALKPLSQRKRMPIVIARLRKSLSRITGARLFLQGVQDIRIGGRQSNAQYQYTIEGDSTAEVYQWAPKLMAAMQKDPTFQDVNSDQQQGGASTNVAVDRTTASRLGLTMYQVDNTLYDAFGQRSVSTIYNSRNQYYVVMEVAPRFWQRPDMLDQMQFSTAGAQASGTQTTALTGSLTAPAPVSAPAVIPAPKGIALSSQADSATNLQSVPSANPTVMSANPTVVAINPTVLGAGAASLNTSSSAGSGTSAPTSPSSTAASTPSTSSTSAVISGSAAAQAASEAALGATGGGATSTAPAVSTAPESMVPLLSMSAYTTGTTPLAVNHQSEFVATTISFNLPPNKSLSDAQAAIARDQQKIGFPSNLIGGFAGTALVYEQSLSDEVWLVIAAIAAIYIVLGILYESFAHPLTILSTLPSATLGGVLALMLLGIQFTIIALIGMILLIGIVKKNAILMIDFALKAEREEGMESREAIYQAALTRFRPIMMTTTAALLGALPLCFTFGVGSELRQPLGITIVGGLLVSQALTLFTTPVVYLALDRLRLRANAIVRRRFGPREEEPAPAG